MKKLGEVCCFCSGYTPKASELKEKGAIPYFKVSDMNHQDNLKYLTHTFLFLEEGCKVYPKHTIVFPKNGAAIATNKKRILKKDSVVDLNTGGVTANSSIVSHEYLYLYLLNIDFRQYTRGGAVPTLDLKELKNKDIPLPSLPEQEKIVAELDCLSGIIEKKKQQLKELDALAQSIFYEMFGDPVENEKGWEVKNVGEVCEEKKAIIRANKFFKNDDVIQYIDIASVNNNINIIESTTSFRFEDAPSRAQQVVNYGDILISLVRPNLRNIAVVQFNDNSLVASSGFCVLRVGPNIDYLFLKHILLTDSFTTYLMDRVAGANYPAVREEDIKKCSISVPPLSLQHSFASKVEAIEKQKELIKQSIAETELLFNSRMQYYFG